MIIQRWQSVLLLITVVMMALFSFSSLAQFNGEYMEYAFSTMGISSEGIPTGGDTGVNISTWWLFALSIMSAFLPLIAIFLFKAPKRQRTLCMVTLLFIIATMSITGYIGYCSIPGTSPSWSSIIIAPFVAIVTTIIAYSLIGKDMRLISSMDRLR